MSRSFLISLFPFLILFSCQSEQKHSKNQAENSRLFKKKIQLLESCEISLPLDTLIGFENSSICAFKHAGRNYVSILNIINPSIYIYDYGDKRLVHKIKLQNEGPDGIGKINSNISHFMNQLDTIYILNSWTKNLYVLNGSGRVIKKIPLESKNSELLANAYSSSANPIKKLGDNLYLPLYPINPRAVDFDFTKIPTVLRLNLHTGQPEPAFYLPEIYNSFFWGLTPFKYQSNFIYLDSLNSFIFNFAIDPFLYEYVDGKLSGKHFVGTEYFKKIKPFSIKLPSEGKVGPDFDIKDKEYALTTPDFNFFLYDDKMGLFIRMAYIRPTLEQYKSGVTLPHCTLIVFDKNFNKLGETFLNGGIYRPDIFFFNEDGLHIARQDKYSRNENVLTFSVFNISEKL